jgi:hypothetical protein
MKKNMQLGSKIVCLTMLLLGLALGGFAQRDSIPHIVAGKFDWSQFKQAVNAPVFQQNDMAIYVLRKDSLMELISKEENSNWIKDFHFIDINADRWLDAFYCGPTKARGGYYTYFMLADTGLRFPIKLSAPGYVHTLTPGKEGLEFILRDDAHGKGYLHTISEYYYNYKTAKLDMGWQVQMLSTTEVPIMRQPERFVLHYPAELRASARVVNEPAVDYNQDGKPESIGNVVAMVDAGMPLLRVAELDIDGRGWSFVLMLATPLKNPIFQPIPDMRMAYAGWVLTEALIGK